MPRSSVGMSEVDGDYVFDINQYLIDEYPTMDKPSRRAICCWVRDQLDVETIEEMVDHVVMLYALAQQGWEKEEDDDTE